MIGCSPSHRVFPFLSHDLIYRLVLSRVVYLKRFPSDQHRYELDHGQLVDVDPSLPHQALSYEPPASPELALNHKHHKNQTTQESETNRPLLLKAKRQRISAWIERKGNHSRPTLPYSRPVLLPFSFRSRFIPFNLRQQERRFSWGTNENRRERSRTRSETLS